jgi:hypothetical protein
LRLSWPETFQRIDFPVGNKAWAESMHECNLALGESMHESNLALGESMHESNLALGESMHESDLVQISQLLGF